MVPYQTTHNTGGAVMGSDPKTSVLNRYLQSWDVPNVFVMGASAFPQNAGYNPTGTVGALTYWALDAIFELSEVARRAGAAMRMRVMRLRHLIVLLPLLRVPAARRADPDNYVDVARGKALATAGDCVACHTAQGGTPFAGGLALQTPFGAIMTPNITPDNATGIGSWSADDFARAMHEGRRPGGTYLYPAFPYPYYTKVTREDIDAIYAYLRTLPPVDNRVNRNTLPFPFNIRAVDDRLERAVLHTRRRSSPIRNARRSSTAAPIWSKASAIAAPAIRRSTRSAPTRTTNILQGNQIDNWTAPNITNDMQAGPRQMVGRRHRAISEDRADAHQPRQRADEGRDRELDLEDAGCRSEGDRGLSEGARRGRLARACAAGGRPIRACRPARRSSSTPARPAIRAAAPASSIMFPKLAGNVIATQDDPASLIRIIIAGGRAAATDAMPTAPAMPSLGYRLERRADRRGRDLCPQQLGQCGAPVSAETVKAVRARVTGAGD